MTGAAKKRLPTLPLAGRTAPAGRSAFTLVELVVAIFIIAILVTLVVNVARYVYDEGGRRQTRAIQEIVLDAVEAYHQATVPQAYPPSDPVGTYLLLSYLKGDSAVDDNERARIRNATGDILLKLPEDAVNLGVNPPQLVDGFGRLMTYKKDQGAGGTPLLTSAGPDGKLDTADDIRSDGR